MERPKQKSHTDMLRLKTKLMWIVSILCFLSIDASAQISMTLDDALSYIEANQDRYSSVYLIQGQSVTRVK